MQGVQRPAPTEVRRFRAACDCCPSLARVPFYSESERDSFARRHVLATKHLVHLTEENLPCPT